MLNKGGSLRKDQENLPQSASLSELRMRDGCRLRSSRSQTCTTGTAESEQSARGAAACSLCSSAPSCTVSSPVLVQRFKPLSESPIAGQQQGQAGGKDWAAGKHSATELTCWWMLPCKIHGCPAHKTLAAMHRDHINLLNSRNLKVGALLSCNGEIMVLAASACKEKKKQNTKNTHQTCTIDLTSS